MRVTRLYTGDDGRSHFEEIELAEEPMKNRGFPSTGVAVPGSGVVFQSFEDSRGGPNNPLRRQFIVILAGTYEAECADGAVRVGPGSVLFAEDMTGEGHFTGFSDNARTVSFGVPDEFELGAR
jgi:hypothetical protein